MMSRFCFILIVLLMGFSEHMSGQGKKMVPETLWEFGRVSDTQVSPDGSDVLFGITRYDVEGNRGNRDLFVMPVTGGTPRNITNSAGSESNARWRPDGRKIGFISSRGGSAQLWEMNPDGSGAVQVSQVEGGISGFGYAPDMKHVFFTKKVKILAGVADMYPDLPDAQAIITDDLMYRHWDHFTDGHFSHVFVAAYSDGHIGMPVDIMEGEPFNAPLAPFGGVSQIAWTPDGQKLAYTSKKLFGKEYALSTNSNIYLYDLLTGETKDLTPFNDGYDKSPAFSPDGRYMAWESMHQDGFEADKTRIMVMDMESGKYRDYSAGFDQSSSGFSWSPDGKILYFVSGIHATYQLFALDVSSGEISQLTDGIHNYTSVTPAGDFLIAEQMSMSMPTEIFRIHASGLQAEQLSFINKAILDGLDLAGVEKRWIETTDGKEMLVWVIYPPHFDPGKKYPALLYCGGGPQNAVSQFFSYRWNFQMMAANDYIVVAPNRRGLPTFGQEWNDQISQDYGGQNKQDLLRAIDVLKEEPFIDEERLGAVGASYGGFSVYWLAGNHEGRFSAFIAHCGMFNFESWYGTTEEMFFANHDMGGAYWQKPRPRNYDFSPHRFAGNWDTPILVIHGAKDFRVPYSEGMQAFNAAQLQGIPSRFLLFPEENHWVLKPQNSILWQREFFKWLDKWLK
jgi:dipeptidyl aminopeptidase/acylaminoacyl peptidase